MMKKFMFALLAVAVGLASCEPKEPKDPIGPDVPGTVKPVADPEPEDLAKFEKEGHYVVAIKFEEQVCNDIIFPGTYNKVEGAEDWSTDPKDGKMLTMTPLEGFDKWYYVVVPCVTNAEGVMDNSGKPVQLANDGTFSWDYQTGDADSWELLSGIVTIEPGYSGEANLKGFDPKDGPIMLISKYFKNHNTPCVEAKVFDQVVFNLEIKGEDQEKVYLHGPFVDAGWNGVEMTKVEANKFTYTLKVEGGIKEKTEYQYTLAADNWDAKGIFEEGGEWGSGNQFITSETMNDVVYGFAGSQPAE